MNRVGNWYLAVRPATRRHYALHHEALVIFQSLHDGPGLAQTFNLLGLTTYLGGNPVQGAQYFKQAIALFEALHDRQGLASSLSTLSSVWTRLLNRLCGFGEHACNRVYQLE